LGNPGKRFERTRHNVGFDTADTMAASFGFKLKRRCFRLYRSASLAFPSGSRSLVVQPLTYMNNSGAIVGHFIPKRFSVSDVVVVCDTLDLPVGAVRIRKGGSTAGHKGLASLSDHLGESGFIRVYIGIGRPVPPETVVQYVLDGPHDPQERSALDDAIAWAAQAVAAICEGKDLQEVMRVYNRRSNGG
jgi:PTH1 family peptidyl-tRNA hydrolase